jgi:O-antigen/teichoic acid export membrane protein
MTSADSVVPLGSAPDPLARADGVAEASVLDTPQAGPAALRGSALRTSAYVLGILLSLISARVLIDHLGVSNFGRYVTVLSLITIVGGFTEGGLNAVVLREFATLSDERRRQMMRSAVGMRLVLTSAGVALAVAFAAGAGYSTALVLGTLVAGAGLVIQLLQSTFAVVLQAQLRFGWVSAAELVRQVVNVALLVTLALAGAGLVPLLAVAVPASAASLLFTLPLVSRYTSLWPSFHLGRLAGLLRESIPWAVIAAVNIVYFRVAIVLMSLISSPRQTGYFATSFRITEILVGIPGLVVTAVFPILARAREQDSVRFAKASGRIFELALIAGAWVVLAIEVGAPFAIHLIAGNKADPSIGVLRIQGAALIGTFVAFACGFPLLLLRRYRAGLFLNVCALVASAVLTALLAPPLGAQGAAVATLAAELGLALGVAVALKRADPAVQLPLSTAAIVAFAACAAIAVGLTLPVHPLIGVAIASGLYFVGLKLLGRFPPEVRELLAGWRGTAAR